MPQRSQVYEMWCNSMRKEFLPLERTDVGHRGSGRREVQKCEKRDPGQLIKARTRPAEDTDEQKGHTETHGQVKREEQCSDTDSESDTRAVKKTRRVRK